MSEELNRLRETSHDKVELFDFDGKNVPCIILDENRHGRIIAYAAGNPLAAYTNLNILQDGLGHVFVEIVLTFSTGGISEKILIDASRHLDFFKCLADTAMIAFTSSETNYGKNDIFMIQLPRKDKAEDALDIIKGGLDAS